MKKLFGLLLMLLSFTGFANANTTLNNIQLKDINNNTVTLEQYKGKNLYVKMWASWCPICLSGMPEINELSAEQNKNFNVITIVSPGHRGEKSKEAFIEWYKGLEYKNIIVLLDENGEVIKKARVRGYPSNLILDAELNLKKTIPGHLSSEQIKQMFK
ncbi:MAG TPA: hypothetical protein DD638_05460 [Pasteurellaceae bacterium]|nr:hypothetical protein [Pasteurellaceae bacterium]